MDWGIVGSHQRSTYKSIIFGLLIFSQFALAESFIYQPKFRATDELKTALAPFLEGEGKVAAVNNKLVITASQEKIDEIKAILEGIDKGARQLIVQVKTKGKKKSESESVQVEDPLGTPSVSGSAVAEKTKSGGFNSLTISEGADSFIQTERGGFNAIVRVTGKAVVLDIYQQSNRVRKDGISHSYNSLKTSVHGQLDEWIEIGQIATSEASKSRYTVGGSDTSASSKEEVSLRVRLAK